MTDWIEKFIRGSARDVLRRGSGKRPSHPDASCAVCLGKGWISKPIEGSKGAIHLRCQCVWAAKKPQLSIFRGGTTVTARERLPDNAPRTGHGRGATCLPRVIWPSAGRQIRTVAAYSSLTCYHPTASWDATGTKRQHTLSEDVAA